MKKIYTGVFFLSLIYLFSPLNAQFKAVSGGLGFSSGVDFNTGTTGNPALFIKGHYQVNKKFYIVPDVMIFNPYKRSNFQVELRNYMFQADVDAMYRLFREKSVSFMGFAGVNATTIVSKWKILESTASTNDLVNKTELKPGLNVGGAFQLFVNDSFDAYISGKYLLNPFNQIVINVGAIYYFADTHRKGIW